MSRTTKLTGCLLGIRLWAFAQSDEPKIGVNLEGLRYPPIARQARILGSVVFEVTPAGRKLLSASSPLLAKPAEENLATWELPPLENGKYVVAYRFEFSEKVAVKRVAVPIGNKLQRFFRKLVGAQTETVVNRCDNHPNDLPPTFTVTKGDDTKIDVSVPAYEPCLETNVAQVALNSHL